MRNGLHHDSWLAMSVSSIHAGDYVLTFPH